MARLLQVRALPVPHCLTTSLTASSDIEQLKNRGPPIDIFISHDWPLGIEQYGDTQNLLKAKPFFRDEASRVLLASICFQTLTCVQSV